LNQAIRNANDGISMLQTADGATKVMVDMLNRMRELAVQASSDSYGTSDRIGLDTEFSELKNAVTSVIQDTSWNGKKLLDRSLSTVNFQIGMSGASNDKVQVDFTLFAAPTALTGTSVTDRTNALSALTLIDADLTTVGTNRARWGAAIQRLTHAADNSANVSMNLSSSKSQLLDADYAKATADLARAQIIQEAGTAMLSQANQQGVMVLHLLA